ncbi:MAG TPA: CPBP family intramembrane glutamic endopeptidase [Anaeromyxobacter sp.]|nr:CPBP family intramembrane glutamic endopeptidase [Anaeromyxobacter sp.]
MSPRLDLPLALGAWFIGFGWLAAAGTFVPLAVVAVATAARLVAGDPATRRLLRPTAASTAAGGAVGAASIVATYSSYPAVASAWPELSASVRGLYRMLDGGPAGRWSLLLVVCAVGAAEEIVWRGRMLGDAPDPAGRRGGVLASALAITAVYGAVHLASGSRLLPVAALVCGVGWASLRIATRSLWAPVVAHLAWSSAILVVRPLI